MSQGITFLFLSAVLVFPTAMILARAGRHLAREREYLEIHDGLLSQPHQNKPSAASFGDQERKWSDAFEPSFGTSTPAKQRRWVIGKALYSHRLLSEWTVMRWYYTAFDRAMQFLVDWKLLHVKYEQEIDH